ncbi:MAG: PEGA domain-containing protein [Acidobacteriia bacterium]|nr:PEGA domain-containing protein [Terriglobia bacterium]
MFVSLVLFSVLASVPHPPAVYVNGSAAVPNGTVGSLNLGDDKEFCFDYADDTFKLLYKRILGIELDSKPGAKGHLASSVSWVPKVGKKQAKLLTILYKGENDTDEAAVFEIRKEEFESIASILEARTGKRVSYDHEETLGTRLPPPPPQESALLVPVTFTSTPRGAMVTLWGQTAGRTPLTTKLGPGTYTIQMTSSGLPPWTRDIEVEPGKPLTVAADLGHIQPNTVVITQVP